MKTAILTDSTAYIPKELREKYNIHMIPLFVNFGHEAYSEEIEITVDEFYEQVRTRNELPTTSQPAIGLFAEMYEKLASEYDSVVSIHLSSGISATLDCAAAAAKMVENIEVHLFDTEISCMVQGFYVLEAAELAEDGKLPEDILARLNEMKKSVKAYFMVDDLTHLQRGGRLSNAQALLGSLLQVKPILHFVDKTIVPFEKIRTEKKAIKRMLELFDQDAFIQLPLRATIIHANREEDALKLKNELAPKYPHVDFIISYFGPVIGTHLGEGALGLGWYMK